MAVAVVCIGLSISGALARDIDQSPEVTGHSAIIFSNSIETGDLLFIYEPRSFIGRAIALTTEHQFKRGPLFSHVVALDKDVAGAVDAIDVHEGGVQVIALGHLMMRYSSEARFVVAKFKPEWSAQAREAVAQIKQKALGTGYDTSFSWESSKQYCSKLIQTFYRAVDKRPLFDVYPMSFGTPGTPLHQFWKDYFLGLKLDMPLGKLGVSPLSLYLDGFRKGLFRSQ